jgi:hypothetical protein
MNEAWQNICQMSFDPIITCPIIGYPGWTTFLIAAMNEFQRTKVLLPKSITIVGEDG